MNKINHNHPIGRVISLMEMSHMMLKYKEVHKNMVFENNTTRILELNTGIDMTAIKSRYIHDCPQGETNVGFVTNQFRQAKKSKIKDKWETKRY